MSECLPDLPRYVRQRDKEWQGADHQRGPWRPIPAPQSGLPWKTDGPAVPESREPASVAANPTPLSPAAQAVLLAADEHCECFGPMLAAALHAVADQVVPHEVVPPLLKGHELERLCQRQYIRTQLLAISDELEAQP